MSSFFLHQVKLTAMFIRPSIGILFILNLVFYSAKAQENSIKYDLLGDIINDYISSKYPDEQFIDYLYVGVQRQKLYYFNKGELKNIFIVSTATKGAGNNISSNQTPVGLHFIKEKIGKYEPIGTLFKNKKSTGNTVNINIENADFSKDEITSRILSLAGKEQGINKGKKNDTYSRGIYIHGTSDEANLGKAKSHGCIRMKNKDVINLFDLVNEGTLVVLIDN